MNRTKTATYYVREDLLHPGMMRIRKYDVEDYMALAIEALDHLCKVQLPRREVTP